MTPLILGVLAAAGVVFAVVYIRDLVKGRATFSSKSFPALLGIGFVTNFFDTLGIGSFAPTTALYKFLRLVDDRLIPGTMNVGHTLPVVAQGFSGSVAGSTTSWGNTMASIICPRTASASTITGPR